MKRIDESLSNRFKLRFKETSVNYLSLMAWQANIFRAFSTIRPLTVAVIWSQRKQFFTLVLLQNESQIDLGKVTLEKQKARLVQCCGHQLLLTNAIHTLEERCYLASSIRLLLTFTALIIYPHICSYASESSFGTNFKLGHSGIHISYQTGVTIT